MHLVAADGGPGDVLALSGPLTHASGMFLQPFLYQGGAILILETRENAEKRGAKILGVLAGCGEMADSFHRTRSSPDGKPIIGCIRRAVEDAGLMPDDIEGCCEGANLTKEHQS